MAVLHSSNPSPQNRWLAALPAEDLAQICHRLKPVEFGLHEVIQASDKPIKAVYFPQGNWASLMALMKDGSAAEVGIVGFNGMVGL